jgi:hypothetical protein
MVTHFKNRLLVTSLALAAAGILTCVASLLEAFFPRGSVAAFLGLLFSAGVAIAAIMIAFAWTCEKADERGLARQRQGDGERGAAKRTSDGKIARTSRLAVLFDRPSPRLTLVVSPQLHYYPLTLHGVLPPVDLRSARAERNE